MNIKKFELFENTANNTQGNTKGMGNVKAPQPTNIKKEESDKKIQVSKETPKEIEKTNECVKSFNEFLNEDGGVATATLGNASGMGDVAAPPVSTDGSINSYTGNGSPTETTGSGSGDLPAYDMGTHFGFNKKDKPKKKKKKATKESRHVGTETSKENMYVTSWTDWINNTTNN